MQLSPLVHADAVVSLSVYLARETVRLAIPVLALYEATELVYLTSKAIKLSCLSQYESLHALRIHFLITVHMLVLMYDERSITRRHIIYEAQMKWAESLPS